jgi:putative flippase GtrA
VRGRCGLKRWLKFNAVGAMGIVVQLTVLMLFRSGLGLNYLLATAAAVEAAVLHNFLWHEGFTWAERKSGERLARLVRFNLSCGAASILGNMAMMKLLAGWLRLNYIPASLLSIAACSLLNFFVSDQWVFQPPVPRRQSL